jgi:cellulose synthase/poly-beta-1,6-N-acetylglucosamine synthase-like glycosyltransferase
MLSIIITTYRETKTLEQTLRVILAEKLSHEKEILVAAPDNATRDLIQQKFNDQVKFIQDEGHGKPAALNLAFRQARGDILILTDGDVIIESDSLAKLIQPFENQKIGAVCGQPISISPRDTMLGFWSHFLTYAAHRVRLAKKARGEYLDCSGYLYAVRSNIVEKVPENVLADDIYISTQINQAGYKIDYIPESKVKVKYPTNFKDWIIQKRRSAAGHSQSFGDQKISSPMRNFWHEAWGGFKLFYTYPKNLRETLWLKALFVARIYLWLLIFIDKKILRKKYSRGWKRVESSK